MKKLLSISSLALCGLLWAQQSLDITSTSGSKSLLVNQILSIVPGVNTTTFKLVGGSSYSAPTAGQKWVFSTPSSSSVSSSSSSTGSSSSSQVVATTTIPNQIHWEFQNDQVVVQSAQESHFQLLNLQGQILSQSQGAVLHWQFDKPASIAILRIQGNMNLHQYLIRAQE